MKQQCTIIFQDEEGKRSRIVFVQNNEFEAVNMLVKELDPAEAIKLMMLVRNLATNAMEQIATMKNSGSMVQ